MTPLLAGTGHPAADASLRTVWFALLGCLIATVGQRGIAAVGVIQAVVAGIMLCLYLEMARRLVGICPSELAIAVIRRAGPAAVAGVVVLALRRLGGVWVSDTSWLTLILPGGVFTLTYLVGMLLVVPGMYRETRRLLA